MSFSIKENLIRPCMRWTLNRDRLFSQRCGCWWRNAEKICRWTHSAVLHIHTGTWRVIIQLNKLFLMGVAVIRNHLLSLLWLIHTTHVITFVSDLSISVAYDFWKGSGKVVRIGSGNILIPGTEAYKTQSVSNNWRRPSKTFQELLFSEASFRYLTATKLPAQIFHLLYIISVRIEIFHKT